MPGALTGSGQRLNPIAFISSAIRFNRSLEDFMFVHVLGSGAGGGFPQWNCNCANCRGVREGTIKASPRTQSSIAVSANGSDWILFNASPDIKKQMDDFPALQPAREVRDTALTAIVITDAQIDHVTGML